MVSRLTEGTRRVLRMLDKGASLFRNTKLHKTIVVIDGEKALRIPHQTLSALIRRGLVLEVQAQGELKEYQAIPF